MNRFVQVHSLNRVITVPQARRSPVTISLPLETDKGLFGAPRQRWLIVFLTLATFFLLLGTRSLNEPDEGRYTEIAREMVATGDWIVPHFWYLPHLDKPPMTYWCEAASMKLFGQNEWAVRLPLALAGLSGIWATFLLARSMIGSRAAWISILLLQTSFLYFAMARFLTTDIFLTQFIAWAIYFFWQSWRELRSDSPRWGRFLSWHLPGWAATGLAFLVKGPIALAIPAVALLTLAIFRRRELSSMKMLFTGVSLGMAVLLVLILPWFLAVFHREPETATYMMLGQVFGHLFGGTIENRRGSLFYFFGILAVGLLPWSVLLGWLWRRRHWRSLNEASQDAWLMLNAWAIFTFVVFSLSHAKLPAYILPIFPALVIMLAWRFFPERPAEESNDSKIWRICLVSAFAVPAVFPLLLKFEFHNPLTDGLLAQLLLCICAAYVLFRASRPWHWSRQVSCTLMVAWLGLMTVIAETPQFETSFRGNQTLKPLGQALRDHYLPGTPIVFWGKLPQGLPFYAQPLISEASRPYFGKMDWQQVPFEFPGNRERAEPYLLMNDHALTKVLSDHKHVLIVVSGELMTDFLQANPTPSLHLVAESGQYKLFESTRAPEL